MQYKDPLDFYPERSVQPAYATDAELRGLEARRTAFVSKPTIGIRHPAYPDRARALLSFPALDDDGVDYDLAITACYLIVENPWPRDGMPNQDVPYLSYSIHPREMDPDMVITPLATEDTIIRRTCYLHVPSYTDQTPYPITPSFEHWKFPHVFESLSMPPHPPSASSGSSTISSRDIPAERPPIPFLPAIWRAATIPAATSDNDLMGRAGVIARDRTCRVTQFGMGVEAAHLVPREADAWFNVNSMKWYAKTPDDGAPINDLNNCLLLRGDIHHMLNRREIVIMPKKLSDRYVFVLKVIKSKLRYLYDAYEIYHNRICLGFSGVKIEYLFGRFAWNILYHETMQVVLTPHFRYPLRVYNARTKTYEVQDRFISEFKKSRSQSTGGSNKHTRSSGPGDDEACSVQSNDTLASDEDSYQQRLHSLDAYNERLAAMERGEVGRGRKRVREHDDRFSNASTEVDVNSDMPPFMSKGVVGKFRKLGEEVILPT
ncbi:hypothetical protein F4818DRAFT_205258 [Hypoxylon cercidicola]|nr:hypothetical protein F4818DRAFT_205258 [Hypoxylon cercidicola]